MNKNNWIVLALGGIAIIIIGIFAYQLSQEQRGGEQMENQDTVEENGVQEQETSVRFGSPQPDDLITSPLIVTGEASGWYFEGSFPVRLEDVNGNVIAQSFVTAQSDWMTSEFVPFEGIITFDPVVVERGYLVLQKDNPSGLSELDEEVKIPVQFEQETMEVQVYFNNTQEDLDMLDCGNVYAATRTVPRTQAVGRAALLELLEGPTQTEKDAGFVGQIPQDVKIQSLRIEDGTAYVDFNSMLEYQMGGSCRTAAVRAQIEETLKQFDTVDTVVISVDGRTEDILQP